MITLMQQFTKPLKDYILSSKTGDSDRIFTCRQEAKTLFNKQQQQKQ